MESRSHDLGAKLRIHSLTVDCETFSNKEKDAVVVPVTSVEAKITGSKAIFHLCFYTLLLKCLTKTLERSSLV